MRTRRNVKVLVLVDDPHLGEVGKVVDVRPGYARNYLLPRGRACRVTKNALAQVERAKERAAATRAKRAAEISALAKSLKGLSLTLEERASDEGHLFGSVAAAELAKALQARGMPVEERQIVLDRPLKELGIFAVPIRLEGDQMTEIRVWIVDASAS